MAAQRTLLSRDQARLDLSPVRLLKVPEAAPPFDGELPPPAAISPGGPLWTPSDAPEPAQRRTAPAAARVVDRAVDHTADRGWTRQFAQLLAETLAGVRPQRQFLPWLSSNAPVQLRRIAPAFGHGQRPQVLRVLAAWPADNVAELTVIVRLGPRTHALAARLEAVRPEDGARPAQPVRWLCTDIEAA